MGRRFRSASRGRSAAKRKIRWQSVDIASPAQDFDNHTALTFWLKWPADTTNPFTTSLEPSDETLIRLIMNSSVLLNTEVLDFAVAPVHFCFGAIAFDASEFGAQDYQLAAYGDTSVACPPRPITDGDADWIIRQPFIFQAGNSYQGPVAMPFIESRAQRKLPPNTGILGMFQYYDVNNVFTPANWSFGLDARMAFKSGYTR